MVAVKSAFKGTILRLFIFYMLSIALMLAIVPWRQSGTSESPSGGDERDSLAVCRRYF